MSIAACLLLYSVAVTVVGPPLLRRLTRGGHAPRFGVAAWLTAIGSVLISWVAAAALIIVDVIGHWHHRGVLMAACLALLRDMITRDAGVAVQFIALTVAVGAAAGAALISWRLARTLMRLRARAHNHAQAVRLVGHRTGERDVVVVDAAKPAAYCVSGRPPAIVVTTGAIAALDERQMRAVLAHERAHLAGHHPNVVAALRSLATVFPRIPMMAQGAVEVSRLLEMCADDAAARRHGRWALLSGLITLAGAAPVEALGAADIAVLTRAERLAAPPAHRRAALTSALTIFVVGPLITAVLAASGSLMCGG
ncbi:MAG: M56 family metallopeptidase [Mycobacterium sp.]